MLRRSKHFVGFLRQQFAGEIAFLDQLCRAGIDKRHSVVVLVIFRHVGGRDQNRRLAHRLDLAQGDRACATDHQIRRRHAGGHVVDIRADIEVRRFAEHRALFLHQSREPVAVFTVGVDVLISAVFAASRDQIGDRAVDLIRAETAAEGQHDRALVKPERLARFRLVCRQDLSADRVAGDDDVCFRKIGLCRFDREHDLVDAAAEQLVGHAGIGVLLVNDAGNAETRRCAYHRSGDVAAGADADIGLEFLDDASGFRRGSDGSAHGAHILDRVLRR